MSKKLFLYLILFTAAVSVNSQDFGRVMPVEGKWLMEKGEARIFEIWEKQDDGSLKGLSYIIDGDDSVFLESLGLRETAEGIIYTALIEGQNDGKPVDFLLVSHGNNTYVYENQEHDFPQKIIYEFMDSETLNASVSGKKGEKRAEINFNFKKVLN